MAPPDIIILLIVDYHAIREVMKAVQRLKNGKAAGCGGISTELLTCAVGPISSCLHELFLRVWASGHVPAEWREGIIVSLYKGKVLATNVPAIVQSHSCQSLAKCLLMSCYHDWSLF